jgi:hydrophobic/amphiphilic exporter-1 (mainly G- bacteria), HAE1 family
VNFSSLFIKRPVMTTLVMVAFLIFGIISYLLLPVNDLPAVDFPTISVSAAVPGASAETMAATVATPLERQFTAIAGLDSMTSSSALGTTSVTLQFNLNRNIEGAAQDVQSAIVIAQAYLPASMPTPPTLRKVNPADSPILFISLSSPTLPLYTVDEYAENQLAPRISMVDGVAQVQVYGSQIYAPHVQVDPRKLASYGIGINEVATAITASNVNQPTGTLYGTKTAYNVIANGQLMNAAAYRPLIIGYRGGYPVRLRDIGDVIDSVQTDKVASWFNNKRAIILAVQRQPGTNTIEIVNSIKALLPTFEASLPGSVHVDIMYDRSESIQRSIFDVKKTLLITVGLVVLVIFLFLGNPSTTVIASLTLPVSLLGTFAAMKLYGFSINNISMMALTLCVGFVVDDSIVVLENIVRHMEMGKHTMQAAVDGSREIWFTIVSMTVSLIAVFIPILLMGGIVGRLFFEFAVTLSTAILISGFVSISLTPMLCSRFLRVHNPDAAPTGLQAISEKIFGAWLRFYEVTLKLALEHRGIVVGIFFAMLTATACLIMTVPKGFMPNDDTGQLTGSTEAIQGISFESMVAHQKELAKIVTADPNIRSFMSSVGASGRNPTINQGSFFLILKPFDVRQSVDQIIDEMRKKTMNIPGIKLYLQGQPAIRIGGMSTKAQYQFTLSSTELEPLYKASDDLMKKLRALPEIADLNTDLQVKNLQLTLKVDRNKLSNFGLTMEQVQDALNSAYSTRQVSVIYAPTNQYWVILEVLPKYYRDQSMMAWLRVRTATGQLVPLGSVASFERSVGPQQVNHLGQFPCVTLSFNLKPGVSLSEAVNHIKAIAKATLPPSVQSGFQGTAQQFESSMTNLGILLVIAILVIYIVLGCLYESFIHPLTILSGLPSAGLGALLILLIAHLPLDIYGFLGLILLIGIVKKNAIMMIDFAVEVERKHDLSAEEAIYQACKIRFRPIMMTTMCALLGSLPIALGGGQGAASRQPLGLTIVGGLMVSQLVTLYITPVFYIYLDKLQSWLQHIRNARAAKLSEISP